jgi:hypothetical protein
MPSPRPTKLNTAAKIRRQLNKGKSPSEIAKTTGASLGYVYAIKAKMTPAPAPAPTEPAPEMRWDIVQAEVADWIEKTTPIPAGIAGLHEVKDEPAQPVAAHAASEIVEEAVVEKPDNYKYVWAVAGILLLTALFLWYFAHRG